MYLSRSLRPYVIEEQAIEQFPTVLYTIGRLTAVFSLVRPVAVTRNMFCPKVTNSGCSCESEVSLTFWSFFALHKLLHIMVALSRLWIEAKLRHTTESCGMPS